MTETDPYLWLEDVEGDAALAWVREQNARSLALLEADPRYQKLYDTALNIITAEDRIPYPSFRGEELANFWQDSSHVRGLWRKTTLASYRSAEPDWHTVLDVDALAAAEDKNWVYQGGQTLPPEDRLALVNLSDGGKDASVVREFDAVAGKFVEGGFALFLLFLTGKVSFTSAFEGFMCSFIKAWFLFIGLPIVLEQSRNKL